MVCTSILTLMEPFCSHNFFVCFPYRDVSYVCSELNFTYIRIPNTLHCVFHKMNLSNYKFKWLTEWIKIINESL